MTVNNENSRLTKKTNRTKNATRNIMWGIINKFVMIVLPFITRTVMIYTMGMEYVGLGSLFTSVLQVLSFAELGINSAIVFSMYKPVAENDDDKVCALLKLYRTIYWVVGTIILCIGLALLPFIDRLVKGDVPAQISLRGLFCIYLLNNLIGYFLFAYKQSLFAATQRIDRISKINTNIAIGLNLGQILVLLLTHNYYLFVILIPVTTAINNICLGFLSKKYYPQYEPKGRVNKTELRVIEKKIGGMAFQKIGGIVLTSVDTIVISAFLGILSLALYQNYYYIITAIFGVLTVIMQALISGVGNSTAAESVEKNYADFKKFNFMYIWLVSWCSACLLCLYQPFMRLWVGEKNMLGLDMAILFAVYFFVHKWCDMLYVYQQACGIWWETKFIPLAAACVNLVINIILVQIIGLPGILISTIVSVIFIYNTGCSLALFKTYFRPIKNGIRSYWSRQVMYFVTAFFACSVTLGISQLVTVKSVIGSIIVNLILCLIVPNVIFYFAWKRYPEFQYIISLAGRFAGKLTNGKIKIG